MEIYLLLIIQCLYNPIKQKKKKKKKSFSQIQLLLKIKNLTLEKLNRGMQLI